MQINRLEHAVDDDSEVGAASLETGGDHRGAHERQQQPWLREAAITHLRAEGPLLEAREVILSGVGVVGRQVWKVGCPPRVGDLLTM